MIEQHPQFITRSIGERFVNLEPDAKLIANIGLVYKELLKSNYSWIVGVDLDTIDTELELKGMKADYNGGLNWLNYMYSDAYDEEDKKEDSNGRFYAELTIFEALKKYACANIGDLIITPEMLDFVKNAVESGALTNYNIQRSKQKYEQAFLAANAIKHIFPDLNGHSVICLIGTYAPECGFEFVGAWNKAEYNSQGNSAANGPLNFGESWCGISFWSTKVKIITGAKLNGCTTDPTQYIPGSGKCIYEQSLEEQAKANCAFIDLLVPKWVSDPILRFDPAKDNPNDTMACTFLAKAGPGKLDGRTKWEQAIARGLVYDRQNGKEDNYHFASPIYHAMMFARFLKDGEVPKGHPWE